MQTYNSNKLTVFLCCMDSQHLKGKVLALYSVRISQKCISPEKNGLLLFISDMFLMWVSLQ